MSQPCYDLAVIGAGAAGLAAAQRLLRAGLAVIVIEARDRIGGRILTHHRSPGPPIELGAEFIHGRPAQTWDIIQAAQLAAYDVPQENWFLAHNSQQLEKLDDFWPRVQRIMQKLSEVERDRDLSFDEFVASHFSLHRDRQAIEMARMYVEGFNAADAMKISGYALKRAEEESEKFDGDLLFRLANGYDAIANCLARDCDIRLNSPVKSIAWKRDHVCIETSQDQFIARQAIITLPLGVIQMKPNAAGAVAFDPEITNHRVAASRLVMGAVVKVVCRFRSAFWERDKRLASMSFMHSTRTPLHTWWTMLALRAPVLVGWSGGPAADALAGKNESQIRAAAIESPSTLLDIPGRVIADELESSHFHDWQHDPFARGAYSYVPVGAIDAMQELAQPIEDTLFFAGEATHSEGMAGTVAGAIASGHRAAEQALLARRV